MNVFLGLPIPASDSQWLTSVLLQAYPQWRRHSDIRWTVEPNHHLTLHFFGAIDPDSLAELIAHLSSYIHSFLPITVKISQLFNFPKPQASLIAAYVQLSPPLAKLYRQIVQAVRDHQFPMESRVYLPHITLCRAKRRHVLTMEPLILPDYAITLTTLTLYQTQTNSQYQPLYYWHANSCL